MTDLGLDAHQMATFFAVMLLGGIATAAVAAIRPSTRPLLADAVLPLAAATAVGATLGSLYLSESAGFVPCELCWFQRIAMYPMGLILTVAAVRRDRTVLPYVLMLSLIGLAISLYHVQLQLFPEQSSFCEAVNPCTASWVEAFGWMTIPQMAALAFTLIAGLTTLGLFTTLTPHTPSEETP